MVAILVTIAHHTFLQSARPYKQRSTLFLAVGTSLTLLCTLLAALLVRMHDSLVEHTHGAPSNPLFGAHGDGVFSLTVLIICFNFSALILCGAVLIVESRELRRVLKVSATLQRPELSLGQCKRWHLFLSHNW